MFISPLEYPKSEWRLTQRYSQKIDPITYRKEGHNGVDLAASLGTPVFASADGVCIAAWDDIKYGGGLSLRIGYGERLVVGYAHLSRIIVNRGDQVLRGQVIGVVGSTGLSTGPHLHLVTWKDGVLVDPETVFDFLGVLGF